MKRMFVMAGAAAVALGFAAAPAMADMNLQKQAKAAGVEGVNCATCHTAKMPKKGAAELGDKGKWLLDQKKAKNAEKIDGAWLKDYKPPTK